MSYATSAVIAEQNGEFQRAAESWKLAFSLAKMEVNSIYAASRMEFCRHAAHRGWGVPYESLRFQCPLPYRQHLHLPAEPVFTWRQSCKNGR
ncbi:TPA: ANR family transcriptional regulator [Serratia marcescens]